MTDKQTNKLTMGIVTQEVLDDNAAIYAGVSSITDQKTALDASILNLLQLQTKQETDITGNTDDKDDKKEQMAKLAIELAKPLAAFARTSGNEELLNEIDFEYTDLFHVKDVQAAERCQLVHDRLNDNLPAMGGYPVDPAAPGNLQTLILEFVAAVPNYPAARSEKTATTEAIEVEFENFDTILVTLDELMRAYQTTEPDFFNSYTAARKINDTGGRKVSLAGMVTDAVDGAVIYKGEVEAVKIGAGDSGSAPTGKTGKYNIKSLEPGSYVVTVTAAGYQTAEINNVVIETGQITYLNIEMQRA